MDPMEDFIDTVRRKVQVAGLANVEVVRRDGLKSGQDSASIDVILLFGVIPFPTLPLSRLFPEMHRVPEIRARWPYGCFRPPLVCRLPFSDPGSLPNWAGRTVCSSIVYHMKRVDPVTPFPVHDIANVPNVHTTKRSKYRLFPRSKTQHQRLAARRAICISRRLMACSMRLA